MTGCGYHAAVVAQYEQEERSVHLPGVQAFADIRGHSRSDGEDIVEFTVLLTCKTTGALQQRCLSFLFNGPWGFDIDKIISGSW